MKGCFTDLTRLKIFKGAVHATGERFIPFACLASLLQLRSRAVAKCVLAFRPRIGTRPANSMQFKSAYTDPCSLNEWHRDSTDPLHSGVYQFDVLSAFDENLTTSSKFRESS